MSGRDEWALVPTFPVPLPCDVEPLVWARGELVAPPHEEVDLALAALGGGRPPCERLSYLWSQLGRKVAPEVTTQAKARTPELRPPAPGDAFDDDVLERLGAVRAPRLRSHPDPERVLEHSEEDAAFWAVRAFPGWMLALALASSTARRASPERWLHRSSFDERLDLDLILRRLAERALDAPLPWAIGLDPWSVGTASSDRVVVPPTWFATVWLAGAAVVDGALTLSLRAGPNGAALARLADPDGGERTVRVERTADRSGWVPA